GLRVDQIPPVFAQQSPVLGLAERGGYPLPPPLLLELLATRRRVTHLLDLGLRKAQLRQIGDRDLHLVDVVVMRRRRVRVVVLEWHDVDPEPHRRLRLELQGSAWPDRED